MVNIFFEKKYILLLNITTFFHKVIFFWFILSTIEFLLERFYENIWAKELQ
jgi:hypothetical protein